MVASYRFNYFIDWFHNIFFPVPLHQQMIL